MAITQEESTVLWSRFKSGDSAAFGQLSQQYYGVLYNYGTKFSKDREFVRDCLQDVFLDLWHRRDQLSETPFVKAYLMTALRNRMLKELRRQNPVDTIDDLSFNPSDAEPSVEHRLIADEHQAEQIRRLQQGISRLTKRQQEMIYLRFYQHLDHAEIAKVMNLTPPSVANLLHRALRELKSNVMGAAISLLLVLCWLC